MDLPGHFAGADPIGQRASAEIARASASGRDGYPIVTFLQVGIDLSNAAAAPDGHVHRYGAEQVDAWAAIITPDGWTLERRSSCANFVRDTQ
jgi:uncharacterized membrane protein